MSFIIRNKKTGKERKVSAKELETFRQKQENNSEWEFFMPTQRAYTQSSIEYLKERGLIK